MGPFFVKRRKIYFEENRFNERFSECLVFYINRHINIESQMYKVTNFGGFREDLATFVDPSRGVSSNSVTTGLTHVVKSEYDSSFRVAGVVLARPRGLVFPAEQMWIVGRHR